MRTASRIKAGLRGAVQAGLGLDRYLDLFARYKLATLRWSDEGEDLRAFLSLVPETGTVLDVGANVGFVTVPLARHVRRGTVHAFEPEPRAYEALRRSLERLRLRNVVTHPLALGDADGRVAMITPLAGRARLPALTHVLREGAPVPAGERFIAECRTLDGMSGLGEAPAITALKIDVEDHEHQVLAGARQLLARHRPLLLCELWETDNRRLCLELLRELGYVARVREGRQLVAYEPGRHRPLNLYFLPGAAARS